MASHPESNPLREKWSRHLRTADELSRKKKFEEAILELEQAMKIDPKDKYARSFLERLRGQWERKVREDQSEAESQAVSFEQRMEMIPKYLANADRLVSEQNYKAALAELAKIYKIDPTNYYAQAYSDRIDELMRGQEEKKEPAIQPIVTRATEVTETGNIVFYKELLREYWFDGKLTEEELSHLEVVRNGYGITSDQHEFLSKKVKFEAYVDALRLAWIDGFLSEHERRTLEFMRNKYAITPEENVRAEELVQTLRQEKPAKEKIVIVDVDKEHVVHLAKTLKKRGLETVVAGNPDEAFDIIQHAAPVALISEATFEGFSMDGFELYRRVRTYPPLVRLPVFFTVRIPDRDVIHAALRLGIDYVLQKPADAELIVAVLEGRKNRLEYEQR